MTKKTTALDRPRAVPRKAAQRPPSDAQLRRDALSRAITRPDPSRGLDGHTALQPDPVELRLVREFDLDFELIPWAKTKISANDRLSHMSKATRTAFWVELARLTCERMTTPEDGPLPWARIVIWVRMPTARRSEVANLQPTAKAIVDGMVLAGLIEDDRDEIVTGPDMRRLRPNGPREIVVQLWA